MTTEDALKRLKHIEEVSGDDEAAHAAEDELRGDVLAAIADGAENAARLASIALRTSEIHFSRWYA